MDCCEERGVARHKGLSQVGTPGCPRWSQAVSCRCSAYREAAVTAVQMPLTPGYGETPLPHDELAALLPEVVEVLDKPITRADVYDLEQGLQDQVFDLLMPTAVEGSLSLDELLSDHFVRDLEPPRHVRRLQFLERMGSCQVVHRGGTPTGRRCRLPATTWHKPTAPSAPAGPNTNPQHRAVTEGAPRCGETRWTVPRMLAAHSPDMTGARPDILPYRRRRVHP